MAREELSQYQFTGRNTMFDIIVRQVIAHFYENAETDADREIVASAYQKHTGFPEYFHSGPPNQIGIFGPPAHGKSSVIRSAVEHVAGLMNKRFLEYNLEAVPANAQVDKDTVVYMNAYLAGKQSPSAITGVQVPKQDGSLETMLPNAYKLAADAFGGYVTFEDVTAAPGQVQTALHMLLDEHVPSEWLRRICFGVTGNLGKADRTAASDVVSSIATRLEMHYMRTTEEEYINYVENGSKFQGEYGDGFLLGYMRANPEFFENSTVLRDRLNAKYSAPRTMDQAIAVGRQELAAYLSAASTRDPELMDRAKGRMLQNLDTRLQGTIGRGKAGEMISYYNLVLSLAFPVVNELVETGRLSDELKKQVDAKLSSEMTPETIGFINGLQDYSARVIGKGLSEAVLKDDKQGIEKYINAWNAITFDVLPSQSHQHQNVRRTYWKLIDSATTIATRLCDGDVEAGKELANKKVGYLSKATGMVMNTELFQKVIDGIKTVSASDEPYRYCTREKIGTVFSDLVKTKSQIKQNESDGLADFAKSIG